MNEVTAQHQNTHGAARCSLQHLVSWLTWRLRLGWAYEGRYPWGHGNWVAVWRNKRTGELREHAYLDH